MRKFLVSTLFISLIVLTGCTKIVPYYKPEIQQGNIISQQQVDQLNVGMTRKQVIDILGNPVLKPAFYNDEIHYISTLKPGKGAMTARHLTVYFKHNKLIKMTGDYKFKQ